MNERNLLFGVLALKAALIDSTKLERAFRELGRDETTSLADVLVAQGALSSTDRRRIEEEVRESLAQHGDDVQAALNAETQVRLWQASAALGEPTFQQTVAGLLLPPAVPAPVHGAHFESPLAPAPPDRTGPRYERLRLHATGGIGQVWLARDQDLDREVALKQLRPDTAADHRMRSRFVFEARITGQLQHPAIVPVYELGHQGAENLPFYVMRFVKGRTLSEAIASYHAKRRPGEADPLGLNHLLIAFVSVCQAIAFAHARSIIHRDLKGQNVLLGDFGEVVVLDWGLARETKSAPATAPCPGMSEAIPGGAGAAAADRTLEGEIMGTPAYMAPEQTLGRSDLLDARTDVYALGAVLYEILTGSPPFTSKEMEGSIADLLRRIRDEKSPRPRQLSANVPPALEAVCLKALAKKPADRFQSAAELAEEVQRWLADEPVHCHREGWLPRLGRWGRRHKAAVSGLATLLIVAVVALTLSTWLIGREQVRTEQARQRAAANFRKAREAIDRFFVHVSEDRLLNEPGKQALRRELLKTAGDYYEEFIKEQADDPALRADLAQTLYQLARVQDELGQSESALQSVEKSIQLFAALHERFPLDIAAAIGLARSRLRKGGWMHVHNQPAQAEAEYILARDLLTPVAQSHPERTDAIQHLAYCHQNLARICMARGQLDQAVKANRQALDLQEALARADPGQAAFQDDLAATSTNLAVVLISMNDRLAAADYFRQALDIHQRLVKAHPKVIEFQRNLAKSWNNLAMLYGKGARAEEAYRQALGRREKIAADNCGVPAYQAELANSHQALGNFYVQTRAESKDPAVRRDLTAKAAAAYRKTQEIFEKLRSQYPEQLEFQAGLLRVLGTRGDLAADDDKNVVSELYQQAMDLGERVLAKGLRTPMVKQTLRNAYWGQADIHAQAAAYAKALPDWKRALELDDLKDEDLASAALQTLQTAAKAGFMRTREGRELFDAFQSIPRFWSRPEMQALRNN